ncbi:CCA tRNA nucleotidyltransferase [Candidatus Woesearchaeota archaeon]|nr:CCA tRNA nucleotidyltransferase [Candidatus Woesearchaeota archaeon]
MAKKVQEILKQVLAGIRPSKQDEKLVVEKVNGVIRKLNKNLRGAKAQLGGSGAKGTWLKSFDADVFVTFNYSKYKDKGAELSDILEKTVRRSFTKYDRIHGSRDYFQVKLDGFTVEIVPILAIKKAKEARNITDVSLLHVAWVKRHRKLADEIRLAKQFCKAAKVYGAESYIRGFSGYVVEILVIYYDGFLKLARAAAKWKDKEVIDAARHYRNKNEIMFELNKAKLVSPLIVIDPVQKDRNAAASISKEKFEQFKAACKAFLARQSAELFEVKEFDRNELEKRKGKNILVLVKATAESGKRDIVGSRLLKVFEFLGGQIVKNDFKIIEKGWDWNKEAIFWFIVDSKELETYRVHEGPLLKSKVHVERFKTAHEETFVKGNRIYAKVKRKYTKVQALVNDMIKDKYVSERVKRVWIER